MSARGDAQCVWSHESSISSSYFPLELRRAISHESGCASCIVPGCCTQVALCKLLHAAARKCSVQVALRKCSAPVAPRKRFAHVLCASWSVQVALRQLLRASALRMCSVQVGLCKCSAQVLCAIALRQLLRASALRMCSVQVGLCKLLCASALCNCSVQVALRKLLCASDSAQVALRKCCRSCGNVLCILFLYLKVAIFQPELRGCAPRTTFVLKSCAGARSAYYTFVLKSCDFPAGAAGVRSAYYVAIFKPELRGCAPRTTFVLKSCDFPA